MLLHGKDGLGLDSAHLFKVYPEGSEILNLLHVNKPTSHVCIRTQVREYSVTHRVSLENINHGMDILEKKIGHPIRVVVQS